MNSNQNFWQTWAEALQRWGLDNLVATLLEATGPLNFLGAQLVYLGQPAIKQFFPLEHSTALAGMLEDPESVREFSAYLRNRSKPS